jgi:hypothetical protein
MARRRQILADIREFGLDPKKAHKVHKQRLHQGSKVSGDPAPAPAPVVPPVPVPKPALPKATVEDPVEVTPEPVEVVPEPVVEEAKPAKTSKTTRRRRTKKSLKSDD